MPGYKSIRVNDKLQELIEFCLGMRDEIDFTGICNKAFDQRVKVITNETLKYMTAAEHRVNVPAELAIRLPDDDFVRGVLACYMLSQKAKFKRYRLKELHEVES